MGDHGGHDGGTANWQTGTFDLAGITLSDGTTLVVQEVTLERYAGGVPTFQEDAASASVTLASVSSTLVTGTFIFTFPRDGHVTGSFVAPMCAW